MNNLRKKVTPKYWRITGHHCHNLKEIRKEIQAFTEISKKDLENEWIKEQINYGN